MKKYIGIFSILLFIVSCNEKIPDFDADDLTNIIFSPNNYVLKTPASFPKMEIPADNPMTTEGVELGRRLFYDPILSRDSTMACANCHAPDLAFSDGKRVSRGIDGIDGKRSSMSLANVGFVTKGLFWDGRVKTLEEQALLPVEDPIEMHNIWEKAEVKLRNSKDYSTRFREAFGIKSKKEISKTLAVKALAQFERSLVSGNAKIDRIRTPNEFSDDELEGYLLFFNASGAPDAQCGHCHTSPFYDSKDYFNNGLDSVSSVNNFKDKGFGMVSGKPFDNGKFRTPSLRNVELTAPYMHDGRFKTLEEVVEHYASGGHYSENIDPFIPQIAQIKMTVKQKKQIILFLKTLTDTEFTNNPAHKNPFK